MLCFVDFLIKSSFKNNPVTDCIFVTHTSRARYGEISAAIVKWSGFK